MEKTPVQDMAGEVMVRTWPDGRLRPAFDLPHFEDVEISKSVNGIAKPVIQMIRHFNIEEPLVSSEIESRFKVQGATVRKIVRYARLCGYPVGSNSRGYYWARNIPEMQVTIDHLKGRHKALFDDVRAIEIAMKSWESLGTS